LRRPGQRGDVVYYFEHALKLAEVTLAVTAAREMLNTGIARIAADAPAARHQAVSDLQAFVVWLVPGNTGRMKNTPLHELAALTSSEEVAECLAKAEHDRLGAEAEAATVLCADSLAASMDTLDTRLASFRFRDNRFKAAADIETLQQHIVSRGKKVLSGVYASGTDEVEVVDGVPEELMTLLMFVKNFVEMVEGLKDDENGLVELLSDTITYHLGSEFTEAKWEIYLKGTAGQRHSSWVVGMLLKTDPLHQVFLAPTVIFAISHTAKHNLLLTNLRTTEPASFGGRALRNVRCSAAPTTAPQL
jgi:hypothetical protein